MDSSSGASYNPHDEDEGGAGDVVGVVVVILAILWALIFLFKKSVFIVSQAEGIVIERFGRFSCVLQSGINFVVPFMDTPRAFTWRKTYIDANGVVKDDTINNFRIDLRESVFNFLRQEVYTKDTILLDVNSLMYYRITDIKKAVYEVDDLQAAISNVAQTQLKEAFGNMTFTEAMTSQDKINDSMRAAFSARFSAWGICVERMEMLDMTPKRQTSDAMKKQMIAERERRGDFITAEGKKSAMRLQSEGTKLVKLNMGVAEQEATRKTSEGEAGAKVELARAESQALNVVADAIAADGASQTEYMLAQRYMELFRRMVDTVDNKTIYLPYEASNLAGLIGGLSSCYGPSGGGGGGGGGKKGKKGKKAKDEFGDLS